MYRRTPPRKQTTEEEYKGAIITLVIQIAIIVVCIIAASMGLEGKVMGAVVGIPVALGTIPVIKRFLQIKAKLEEEQNRR